MHLKSPHLLEGGNIYAIWLWSTGSIPPSHFNVFCFHYSYYALSLTLYFVSIYKLMMLINKKFSKGGCVGSNRNHLGRVVPAASHRFVELKATVGMADLFQMMFVTSRSFFPGYRNFVKGCFWTRHGSYYELDQSCPAGESSSGYITIGDHTQPVCVDRLICISVRSSCRGQAHSRGSHYECFSHPSICSSHWWQ